MFRNYPVRATGQKDHLRSQSTACRARVSSKDCNLLASVAAYTSIVRQLKYDDVIRENVASLLDSVRGVILDAD